MVEIRRRGHRYLAFLIVLTTAIVVSPSARAQLGSACGVDIGGLYDTVRTLQNRSADFLSGFLPDRSGVRLRFVDALEDAEELEFFAGRITDPKSTATEDPAGAAKALTVQSVTLDDQARTLVTLGIPKAERLWWPRQRFFVAGCKDGSILVSTIVDENVSRRGLCALLAGAFTVLLYLAVALAVALKKSEGRSGFSFNPVVITAGFTGRGSLSRLQIFFFTLIVAGLLFYIWLRTGVLSGLSQDVLLLLGIAGAGAAGAEVTAVSRNRLSLENWAWLKHRGWTKPDDAEPRWRDLITSGNSFDVYKFQMLTFSLIVGLSLMFTGLTELAEFTIPPTLLGVLGLSQVVYVGGKAVAPATFEEVNKALDALRKHERDIAAKAMTDLTKEQRTSYDELARVAPAEYAAFREASRKVAEMVTDLFQTPAPDISQPQLP